MLAFAYNPLSAALLCLCLSSLTLPMQTLIGVQRQEEKSVSANERVRQRCCSLRMNLVMASSGMAWHTESGGLGQERWSTLRLTNERAVAHPSHSSAPLAPKRRASSTRDSKIICGTAAIHKPKLSAWKRDDDVVPCLYSSCRASSRIWIRSLCCYYSRVLLHQLPGSC